MSNLVFLRDSKPLCSQPEGEEKTVISDPTLKELAAHKSDLRAIKLRNKSFVEISENHYLKRSRFLKMLKIFPCDFTYVMQDSYMQVHSPDGKSKYRFELLTSADIRIFLLVETAIST